MSLQACAKIVARGDPDRFRAVMTLPLAARERVLPIYAFNVEVARAPWVTQEPLIAEMRLQWWRDVLEEIAAGGPVRRHEVVDALAPVLRDSAEARAALSGVIDARRWDIAKAPFADSQAFDSYSAQTGGGLMAAGARALGAPDDSRAWAIGQISAVANMLIATPALVARGLSPFVDDSDAAIAALARRWLDVLGSARLRGRADRATALATRTAWRMRPVLQQAARDPAAVRDGRLGPDGFGRQLALWRAMLQGY